MLLRIVSAASIFSLLTAATVAAAEPADSAILPQQAEWAGLMVIIILGLFLAAAIIGPVVRILMPEDLPPVHSHDEPPGGSHHHGASGTHGADQGAYH